MPRPQRPWFRFYVEAIHDTKLRRLTPAQRWLWVAVLAMARQSPVPGHLLITAADDEVEPLSEADLADAAAVKPAEVRSGMAAFRKMGMLSTDYELGCDVVAKWGDRQFESDEVVQRTRKHRSERNGKDPPGTTLERSYDVPGNIHRPEVGTPPETETEIQIHHHPQTTSSCGEPDKPDDDESKPLGRQELAEAVCDLLGDQALASAVAAGQVKTSSGGYRRSCRASARTDHLAEAQEYARIQPTWTPAEIAHAITDRVQWERDADTETPANALYTEQETRRRQRAAEGPSTQDRNTNLTGVAAARAALTSTEPGDPA